MGPFSGNFHNLFSSALLALACALSGFLLSLKRFYLYAAAAFLAGLLNYFFLPLYVPFFFTAAVMLFFGARLMIAFTRKYPQGNESKKIEK